MKYIYKILSVAIIFTLSSESVSAQKLKGRDHKMMDQMKADIQYLASDNLQGRLTASQGEQYAGEYIAETFASLGITPMGDNGTYYQSFDITTLRIAGGGNDLKLVYGGKTTRWANFKDYYPISYCADSQNIEGSVFDAGYGIQAPELSHNDYGKSANGKIAIIKLGSPNNGMHSKFTKYSDIKTKLDLALQNGVIGVIFINPDGEVDDLKGELSLRIKPMSIPVLFAREKSMKDFEGVERIQIKTDVFTNIAQGRNVIGFKNNKKDRTVVICAHYDHLGHGEMGGSRTKENGLIHNGADDNASGVAAMLALAKKLKKRKYKKANYLFIAFSGEELGLIGSKYFTNNPTYDLTKVNYVINFDMVGRLDSTEQTLILNGVGTSPAWKPTIEATQFDSLNIKTTESGIGGSDHTSFYLKDIPAIHFFTGQHYEYHMPTDDEYLINYGGEARVVNYCAALIKKLNKQGDLEFTKTKNDDEISSSSFKVTLGIMPDYVYDGDGLRVDAVTDGKPAANAGMQAGDIIIQMGDLKINTMQDYMKALGQFNKGQTITVKVKRGTEVVELQTTF